MNPRRAFLSTTIKSKLLIAAGGGFAETILNPIAIMAQTTDSTLQAKIAALGTTSLQTSRLALNKASNAEVNMFAKFEAAEQEVMGKILKDLGDITPALNEQTKSLLIS
ncbi:hypothetical protein [Pedobacter agri]|uniref:hypothetical protein n=1 Tax=Pedobacter agri TaxID=454586 RepID=UPI00292FBAB3|nr:hypothetical protein [Pedobacter agri]